MSKLKICIDAGHGGKDSGAIGTSGRMEKTDNLKMARALADIFNSYGADVKMTRFDDVFVSLDYRCTIANNWQADLFLSVHRNYYSDYTANGSTVLYGTNASSTSIAIANRLNNEIAFSGGFRNRGAIRQAATVLNKTKMPACTLEIGFVSNAQDNDCFDVAFFDIAKAIVKTTMSYFDQTAPPVGKNYYIREDATLWKEIQSLHEEEKVTLEAFPAIPTGESGNFARVKYGDALYLVNFSDLIYK